MTALRDDDLSDKIQNPERTYVWLEITWDSQQNPPTTEISVQMIVHDVPAYHNPVITGFRMVAPGEYEYKIELIGSPLANPNVHDQTLRPPFLVGRPKIVYAGVNGQTGTARATTVAL
jgi:hypothetical protein